MAGDPDKRTDDDASDEGSERWGLELPWLDEHPRRRQPARGGQPRRPGGSPGPASAARQSSAPRSAARRPGTRARPPPTSAAPMSARHERLETRHLETALKMASVLGEMKGAAMKIGQMASFIDIDFLPPEYREIYQEQLAKLRSDAPAMPWEEVREVLEEEYERPAARALLLIVRRRRRRGRVDRPGPPGDAATTARDVAVKIQYPGVAEALESDLANAGILVRVAKALAPGLDAKAIAERDPRARAGGARLRVRGPEPALLRPRLRRPPVHLRPEGALAALAPAGARQRVGRGPRLRVRARRSPRTSATSSARSSSASASARSTTCSTSTPTPIRATTC